MRRCGLYALLCLLPWVLCGCGSDVIADRFYAQAMALHCGADTLTLTLQGFGESDCRTVCAADLDAALAAQETRAGGRVFIGHTELICMDETVPPALLETLFFEYGISPDCMIMQEGRAFLETHESTSVVHQMRMAQRNGSGSYPAMELRAYLDAAGR